MFEKIGSLYINGAPAKTGAMYQPRDIIGLGDTAPGLELYWKPIDKHSYILAAPALLCISWRQLRDLGFVSGKPFQMDGRMFMVHLPRLGVKPPINRSVPEGISFWGEETFICFEGKKPEQRSPIAGINANSWDSAHPAARRENLGFVPVLDEGI